MSALVRFQFSVADSDVTLTGSVRLLRGQNLLDTKHRVSNERLTKDGDICPPECKPGSQGCRTRLTAGTHGGLAGEA